jgi:molybdenum cofactor biosynthesis enzyme MoaA
MSLDEIGFYTLSEQRCTTASADSSIVRGEIVLTDACNFRCPYCREQRADLRQHLSLQKAKDITAILSEHGLVNLRLSGGEPTIWKGLVGLVDYAKSLNITRKVS